MITACSAAAPPKPADKSYVLYRGVTVVDVANGSLHRNMAILAHGERIEAVKPAVGFAPPPGTKVVELAGLYASPGLINSHVHLSTPPNRAEAEAELKKNVYAGVTTLRDMADDLRQVAELARASLVGEIPGPDVYFAALMAGPDFFADPRVEAVSKGVPLGEAPWMQKVTPQTDLRLAVARARGTGATAIKIYADLTPGLVAAIIKEAHRQDMLAWAHAAVFPTTPDEEALDGVDTMSHVCMLAYQASDAIPHAYHHRVAVQEEKFAGRIDPSVMKVLADMKAHGVILDATMLVYDELAADHAAHPDKPKPYCSPALAARLAQAAYHAGVMISAGTDSDYEAGTAWPALQDELELLQNKAGMKPVDVIRSATLIGAMTMHKQKEMGSLEAGKLADIAFTRDDPTNDVKAYRTVVLTVKRGAAFWRKDYVPPPAAKKAGK